MAVVKLVIRYAVDSTRVQDFLADKPQIQHVYLGHDIKSIGTKDIAWMTKEEQEEFGLHRRE